MRRKERERDTRRKLRYNKRGRYMERGGEGESGLVSQPFTDSSKTNLGFSQRKWEEGVRGEGEHYLFFPLPSPSSFFLTFSASPSLSLLPSLPL
jgi:hypothetical protein